jgi:hypothetical protein
MLSTSKVTLSDINNHDLPGSTSRDYENCGKKPGTSMYTAVSWVKKTIRQMSRREAFERWETKIGNLEITPQAIWPVVKSAVKRDGPKAPTAIYDPLSLKANTIAYYLENQFTPHDLCD